MLEESEKRSDGIREHRVYHGSGADFDHFDHSHMGEGEGAQVYGWGTYMTEVKGIGEGYAIRSMNGSSMSHEVLATFSGRRGAEQLRAEQQKIMQGDGSVFEKAAAVGALVRVKQALSKFWKGVADFLGIHYTSAEEVADRVMKDLLEGVDPRKFGMSGDLRKSIRLPKTEYAKFAHAIVTNKV